MKYPKTVYLFATGRAYEELGTGNQFPYQRFGDAAMSLNPTGDNLPSHRDWRYVSEHQPDRFWGVPLMGERDDFRRALDEKGWFLSRVLLAASLKPFDPTEDMTRDAKDLLIDLLREPNKS